MSKSALASLTAQYTDSENEEEHSPDSQNSQASQVIFPKQNTPAETPEKVEDAKNLQKKKKRKKLVRRLVSYQDDTVISDEEEEEEVTASSEESDSEKEDDARNETVASDMHTSGPTPMEVDDESVESMKDAKVVNKTDKINKYAHYGFSLPAEPKGKPSTELSERIRNMYEKMNTTNMDMNRVIQERKEFRNPSIYEKLIQFCDINEFGTNYPPEVYDPLQWGVESYYEELARVQKNEMVKRQKERKDTDKIEQATALARKVEEEAKKRKSKWDQPAPIKPVVQPALTTTVTGTKGTVISAFGSLPKKPAA